MTFYYEVNDWSIFCDITICNICVEALPDLNALSFKTFAIKHCDSRKLS